jgi:hypothetical protein
LFYFVSDDGFLTADQLTQFDGKVQAIVEKEDGSDRQLWIVLPIAEA